MVHWDQIPYYGTEMLCNIILFIEAQGFQIRSNRNLLFWGHSFSILLFSCGTWGNPDSKEGAPETLRKGDSVLSEPFMNTNYAARNQNRNKHLFTTRVWGKGSKWWNARVLLLTQNEWLLLILGQWLLRLFCIQKATFLLRTLHILEFST